MAQVPYDGVPNTVPDARLPDDFQRVDAGPSAFGGAIAQGAQQFGAGASRAAQFFGQVRTDDALNNALTTANAALANFKSLRNQDALNAQAGTQAAIDAAFKNGRAGLSTPEQQFQFDQEARNYQQKYFSEQISNHADEQAKSYASNTNNSSYKIALDGVTSVAADPVRVDDLRHEARRAAVKQVMLDGNENDSTIVKAAIAKADRDVYSAQALALSVHNPVGAQALVEQRRAELGPAYEKLSGDFRARSEEQQAETVAQERIAQASKRAQGLQSPPVFATAGMPGGASPANGASGGVSDPAAVVRHFEGFRTNAYWDVNHWRTGYGSDTVTNPDGSISPVTAMTTVSREDAERDLARRVQESQTHAEAVVGPAAWDRLTPQAKASITSTTYNYGRLPERLVAPIQSGDTRQIALAIHNLGSDNGGVNAQRRAVEAANVVGKFGLSGAEATSGYASTMTMPSSVSGEGSSSSAFVAGDEPLPAFTQPSLASFEPPAGQGVSAPPAPPLQPIASAPPMGMPSPISEREDALQSILGDQALSPRVRQLAYANVNRWYSEQAAANATRVAELRSSLPDLVEAAEAGVPGVTLPATELWSTLPPAEAQRWSEKFTIAQHVGSAMGAMRWASPADVARTQADIASGQGVLSEAMRGHARSATTGPGVAGAEPSSVDEAAYFRMREGAARRLSAEIDRRNEMLVGPTADPASYVASNPAIKNLAANIDPKDPSTFQRFATASLALQEHLGVPPEQQHLLTRGAAEDLVGKITKPGADARQAMSQLQGQFGASYPKVFSDLVSLGRLPSSYQAITNLPDPNDAQLLARALQESPGGTDDGKRAESWNQRVVTATGAADAPQKLKAAINASTTLKSYLDSMRSQGISAPQIDSITKDVETLGFAKVYFGKMDVASAADSAVDAFTRRFAFMPNGGARVPVESFDAVNADAAATLNDLDAGKLAIPPGFGGHGQPGVQDYINAVKAAPQWIDTPRADGLLLLDHGGRLVRTGDGKPLMVPFANAGWIAAQARNKPSAPLPDEGTMLWP